jgi:hypothetical protein
MISPGTVSLVCRFPLGFDAFFRIGRLIHAPLTLTMSLFESRKMVDGGQEQPKGISDTFCYFLLFLYVKSAALAEILIQNARYSYKQHLQAFK